MNKIKAIVVDMDGTIFDTVKLIIDTFVSVFRSFKPDLGEDCEKILVGMSIKGICKFGIEITGGVSAEKIMQEYTNRYNSYIEEFGTPIKLGLPELFSYIKDNGLKEALATSATKKVVDYNFSHSGFDLSIFDAVCTLDDVSKGKPDVELYELACKKLGIEPSNCLAIEDSYVGITFAKNAHLYTCKVKDFECDDIEKDKMVDYKASSLL